MTYLVGDDEQGWWKVSPAERRAGALLGRAAQVLRGIAYHEAGHALTAWILGIRLHEDGASIVPDEAENSLGHCTVMIGGGRDLCRVQCVQRLAGPEAEALSWGGRPWPLAHAIHAGGDEENTAEALRLTFGQSEEDRAADTEYFRVLAGGLVKAPRVRPALDALAAELLAKKTVTGRRLRTLLRRTLPEEDRLALKENTERLLAMTDFVRRTFHGTDEGDKHR